MGRGRGGGRPHRGGGGGSRGRGGRGGGRGGGGGPNRRGSSRGRGRGFTSSYSSSDPPMSRRDRVHLSQFGEKHPSQELEREFGGSSMSTFPAKRGRFEERGRGRGRGGNYSRGRGGGDRFHPGGRGQMEDSSGSDSTEEEDDEATTPYSELLSVFTGKKQDKTVQIVSDEEEEDEDSPAESGDGDDKDEDDPDDLDLSDDDDDDSDISDSKMVEDDMAEEGGALAGEEEEESSEDDSVDGDDDDTDDEGQDVKLNPKTPAGDKIPEVADVEEDDPGNEVEEEEATVIEDAELDPDMNEVDGINTPDGIDPFVQHFEREMSEELQKELKKDKPSMRTLGVEWPIIEKFTFVGLQTIPSEASAPSKSKSGIDLSELDKLPEVTIPDPPSFPVKNPTLASLSIKSQLHGTIPIANQVHIDKEGSPQPLTSLQTELIDLASRYHDLYFPLRTINNSEEIRLVRETLLIYLQAYCLHAANHVLKTRTRILHHNAKMANKSEVPDAYRDQGFVRPKILMLVPFKDSAFRIVKTLISLILEEEKGNVANKKRFVDDYGGQTLFMPKTNPKPKDYTVTFSGNVEDNFKLGLTVTKKSIKLYTGFYSSDIIIASPLGLRMIIGAEGEKDRDYDFLSSIEMVIMDQAEVFLMQNWDHVLHLMRHVNLQPVTTHGTDFARIRPWALDGLGKYYCQTIVFSSVACPEHSSLLTKYCKNYAGQARIMPANMKGSIRQVTVQLPQVFQKFDVDSIHDADDARFKYFTKHVLPNFKEKLMSHTLIFVSSYFDFVRLRNYFKREEVSFVQICEYTKDKKIARSRDLFFHGTNHFLLYTERSHFFRRHRLKGVGHIIFYQLPQSPQFYPELCNTIQEGFQNRRVRQRKNSSVNVIYCKYDTPRLAAIVGTERAGIMLSSEKNIHAFVSGDL